jgi:hypothetical protein
MRFSVDLVAGGVWVSLTAKAWRTVCASARQQTARIVNEVRQNANPDVLTVHSAVHPYRRSKVNLRLSS